MQRVIVCAVGLAVSACGSGQPDVGRTTGGPLHEAAQDPPPPRAPRPSGRPLADTPITAAAEGLIDLALAAVAGHGAPSPVPTRRELTDPPRVAWRDVPEGRPGPLTVLGFAIEIELVLKRGEPPPDAVGPERWGSIRVTYVLSANGPRLVSLRPRATSPTTEGGAPPPGLEGLSEVARDLLRDLRRGDPSRYELTAADRTLLANDSLWSRVENERLMNAPVAQIQRMLVGLPEEPLAYRLDEVSILVRDADDRLLSLDLNFDPTDGSYALGVDPLVEVRRLWPRRD